MCLSLPGLDFRSADIVDKDCTVDVDRGLCLELCQGQLALSLATTTKLPSVLL